MWETPSFAQFVGFVEEKGLENSFIQHFNKEYGLFGAIFSMFFSNEME
jgi:hypothetical protein